jgi:hypothetical protein
MKLTEMEWLEEEVRDLTAWLIIAEAALKEVMVSSDPKSSRHAQCAWMEADVVRQQIEQRIERAKQEASK